MAPDGTDPGSVYVGVARLDVHLPGADSLKAKRALLNKAKAALKRDLECSVAEVGYTELWQRAALGISVVASSEHGVDRLLDRITAVIERDPRIVVTGSGSEVIVYGPDDLGPFDGLDLPTQNATDQKPDRRGDAPW